MGIDRLRDMRIDRLHSSAGGPASRQAYRALRDAIIATELEPGQRLSENELAERLAVSRTPIREALIRLRDDRFVQIVPQLGTFVTRILRPSAKASASARYAASLRLESRSRRSRTASWGSGQLEFR